MNINLIVKVRRVDWPITKIQKQPPPRSSGMRGMSLLSEDEDKSGGDFIRHRDASGRQGAPPSRQGSSSPTSSDDSPEVGVTSGSTSLKIPC
ncbi:hypothetical protein CDAR_459291 [Caerostris darwini]|uniref:Uncharacterized protein n=1 Tax=Caerostris darwini TaxID=1538125 RepID=A0AAV4PJL5_9ARAC|nr:hypothetical protein CDAR_459291 [Caerostris darwini]